MTATAYPADLLPVHEVRDWEKYDTLAYSMKVNGWMGAPLVVDGHQALTGSHRLAAAEQAGIAVPTVEIADLMADHGHSWTELKDCFAEGDAWYEAACRLDQYLPHSVIEYYGIDIA